ncbi:PREDICTED: aminoacylase-1-like, partial [Rhagoletis zephyria]|uniref:aminoacylase-1-like n=1 Tax=Rhagoletis zephyria TaxID=28612 RepID=UPI00081192B9
MTAKSRNSLSIKLNSFRKVNKALLFVTFTYNVQRRLLKMSSWKNDKEIEIFREYLRIPSVHPDIDYAPVVEFLRKQAADLELPIEVYQPGSPSKPAVVITWVGEQPEQPTIMLNSHMDVVPVYSEKWTHPPFAADIDNDGRIFARGTQDMKCVGMQYLAAIRRLRKDGVTLKRTI